MRAELAKITDDGERAKTTVIGEGGNPRAGNVLQQRSSLYLAASTETRHDAVQVGIVVAGMHHQFEDAILREGGHGGSEGGGVKFAGAGHGEGAICGGDLAAAEQVEEGLAKQAIEQVELKTAEPAALAKRGTPGGLKWIADGPDPAALGDVDERTRDGGKTVGVLVRVEVSDIDAGALELLNLREGLGA